MIATMTVIRINKKIQTNNKNYHPIRKNNILSLINSIWCCNQDIDNDWQCSFKLKTKNYINQFCTLNQYIRQMSNIFSVRWLSFWNCKISVRKFQTIIQDLERLWDVQFNLTYFKKLYTYSHHEIYLQLSKTVL